MGGRKNRSEKPIRMRRLNESNGRIIFKFDVTNADKNLLRAIGLCLIISINTPCLSSISSISINVRFFDYGCFNYKTLIPIL